MVSTLRDWYAAERVAGCGHGAAVRRLARRMGVDEATVERVLRRAEQEAARGHNVAAHAAGAAGLTAPSVPAVACAPPGRSDHNHSRRPS